MRTISSGFIAFLKGKIDLADLYSLVEGRVGDLKALNRHCEKECLYLKELKNIKCRPATTKK